jgi:magnesium transporter
MVLGMVGNVSTQSLAVSIRHLVRNDLNTTRKTARHLFKELRVALVNAVICAVFAFAVSFAVLAIKKTADKEMIALVVALSIMVALIIGGMFGAVAPIIFSKLKIDPTLASGPLIITLNDLITVVIYFGLASVLLGLI